MLVRVARLPSYIALTFARKLVGLRSPMRYLLRTRRDIHNVRRAQRDTSRPTRSTASPTRHPQRARRDINCEPDTSLMLPKQADTYKEMVLRLEEPVQLTQQEFDEFWSLIDTVWSKVCRWKHNSTAGAVQVQHYECRLRKCKKAGTNVARKEERVEKPPNDCSLCRRFLSGSDGNDAYLPCRFIGKSATVTNCR
jgi:hypothetical protein